MEASKQYKYSVGISSQIPHCSLPLRLDSYSKCAFRCSYCFAKNRGGNHPPKGIKLIDENRFERLLANALHGTSHKKSVTTQLLQKRVPFHFGGMSDPFMTYELEGRKTLETLKILKKYQYPTIISTKGIAAAQPEYLKLIADELTVMQFSFSSLNDNFSSLIEYNTPLPSQRVNAVKEIAAACWTSARMQPLIPGNLRTTIEAIYTLADAGVKHVSVELLKLPLVGSTKLAILISKVYKLDLGKYYSEKRIMGLEYLVNREYALETHTTLSAAAKKAGVGYSSADTDLLPYDSSDCCCAGTHHLKGFENFYRYTFSQSIRNALREGSQVVNHKHLDCEWAPEGSIKRYINSKSRIEGVNTIKDWMAWKWNNSTKAIGPLTFYGISETGKYDNNGMKIYQISDEALNLAKNLGFYN